MIRYYIPVLLLLSSLLFHNCANRDERNTPPSTVVDTLEMWVFPFTRTCAVNSPRACLQVAFSSEQPDNFKVLLDSVANFEHAFGTLYKLQVSKVVKDTVGTNQYFYRNLQILVEDDSAVDTSKNLKLQEASLLDISYLAYGNGWNLEMRDRKSITFQDIEAGIVYEFPYVDLGKNINTEVRSTETATKEHRLMVRILPEPCADSLSGGYKLSRVEVNLDGQRTYSGCGSPIGD